LSQNGHSLAQKEFPKEGNMHRRTPAHYFPASEFPLLFRRMTGPASQDKKIKF
jgi:hypothetical protein